MSDDINAVPEPVPLVFVPKSEYDSLRRSANWLNMLESAGVDNWGGISFAYELKDEAIANGEFTEEDFD